MFDLVIIPSTLGIQLLFSLKSSGHRASESKDEELCHCEGKILVF